MIIQFQLLLLLFYWNSLMCLCSNCYTQPLRSLILMSEHHQKWCIQQFYSLLGFIDPQDMNNTKSTKCYFLAFLPIEAFPHNYEIENIWSSEARIFLSLQIPNKAENYGGIRTALRNGIRNIFTYAFKQPTTAPRIKPLTWIHIDSR